MNLHITEYSAWSGTAYDLKIDGSILLFEGGEIYDGKFPPELELKKETLSRIEDALRLLEILNWKELYRPEDIGSVVDDGGSWRFEYRGIEGSVSSRGDNAYPAYSSAKKTTLFDERFRLLKESIFSALLWDVPYGWQHKRKQNKSLLDNA